jgi:hypothetical protein
VRIPRLELTPRWSRAVALATAALLAAVAAWSGWHAWQYPSLLNLDEPELCGLPASDVARAGGGGPRLARRVVLFLVDGLTLDASRDLPTLEELCGRGAALRLDAGFPTYSRPGYHVLLTGVDQEQGGVRTNRGHTRSRFDSVAARARAAGVHTAAVGNSVPWLGELFGQDFELTSFGPGFDRALAKALGPDYGLVVVHLADPDKAAHAFGAASPEYRAAARAVDARIGRALASLDLARDAVIVTADHGQVARGGHGGVEPEARLVPLVMAGAGVRRGAQGDGQLIDVAPTVAALLGLAPPGQLRGRPLLDALAITEQERASIWQAMFWARARSERYLGGLWRARRALDVKRDEALKLLAAGQYDTAYRTGESIVREEAERAHQRLAQRAADARYARAKTAALGLALALGALWLLGRLRVLEPGAGALVAPLGPALFAAAYFLLGGTISFSVARESAPFIRLLGLLGAAAAAVHFLALGVLLGPRGPRRARRAAGLALWTALVAALPAVGCFVVAGVGPVVDLPPPAWTFAPLLAFPLLAAVAAGGALFALVEGRARE